jgi:hypothetical protein
MFHKLLLCVGILLRLDIAAGGEQVFTPPSKGRNCCPEDECHANNDPHMLTFDGRSYDFHIPGVYIMYKHKTLPLEVQAEFRHCESPYATATCFNGAAIRSGNTILIVRFRPVFSIHVHGPDDGTMIIQHSSWNYFTVTLVTGTVIKFNRNIDHNGGIQIFSSITDYNQVQGLCGDDNDICEDDLMIRGNGLSTAPSAGVCQNAYSRLHFDDFGLSWEAQDFENLFLCHFEPSSFCPENLYYCACPIYVNGDGPDELAFFGTLQEAIDHQHQCIRNHQTEDIFAQHSVDSCPPFRYSIVVLNNSVVTIKDGRSPDELKRICQEVISENVAIVLCLRKGVITTTDVERAVGECQTDVDIGGGGHFIPGHLFALQQACVQKAKKHTDVNRFITKLTANVCPGACGLHGECVKGMCRCDTSVVNRGGADCSEILSDVHINTIE